MVTAINRMLSQIHRVTRKYNSIANQKVLSMTHGARSSKPLCLDMFNKFLKVPKLGRFPGAHDAAVKLPANGPRKYEERSSSKVRIVHAGGKVEVYFMAIPACRIMEKYPSHFVTWPEVFRRPWDSVVMPDEILTPGKKYYLVPCRTVRKLRRRILNPIIVSSDDAKPTVKDHALELLNDISINSEDGAYGKSDVDTSDASDTSGGPRAGRKRNFGTKRRVRFKGIEDHPKTSTPSSPSVIKKPGDEEDHDEDDGREGIKPPNHDKPSGGKGKPKFPALTWQPSLASITESTRE